ncbi:YdeI family protein [Pseudoduganella sp. UC29_71]|uniref:YdeI/OmpD-associated family protein n=1 Tax=Pseudoduganella sp. UC29_71 TaxID=3350174 RepID=UPI00366C1A04
MKKNTNPKVDAYVDKAGPWQAAVRNMRAIALDCELNEELKWGVPCYTLNDANIVLLHTFKEYCAILFFKGALLKDEEGVLVQQTKNVQAARQIRFTSASQVDELKAVVKAYIQEAIGVEKAGLQVEFKETADFDMPEEFQAKLDDLPQLQEAFEALTPGRQRAYLLHFASAKQSRTRSARVEQCIPHILAGKGLKD